MKQITWIFLLLILSSCASKLPSSVNNEIQSQTSPITVIGKPQGEGYYALLEKTDNNWKILGVQNKPILWRENPQQEILFVDQTLKTIAPSFQLRNGGNGENAECTPILQNNTLYSLCNSSLSTTEIGMSIGKNIVSCATALCLASGTWKELDKKQIQEIATHSDLIKRVKEFIAKENYVHYITAFNTSQSSIEMLKNFSNLYRKNDPDGLVPEAFKKIAVLEKQNVEAQKRREVEIKEKKAAIQKAQIEADYQAKIFRKTLKIGSETNCGPVIEIKGILAKIYFPIKDYGTEHWLNINTIYPNGQANCKFINGNYQDPS